MPCAHEGMRTFVFSTGDKIQLCPGCSKFDAHRKAILNPGKYSAKTVAEMFEKGYTETPTETVDEVVKPLTDEGVVALLKEDRHRDKDCCKTMKM